MGFNPQRSVVGGGAGAFGKGAGHPGQSCGYTHAGKTHAEWEEGMAEGKISKGAGRDLSKAGGHQYESKHKGPHGWVYVYGSDHGTYHVGKDTVSNPGGAPKWHTKYTPKGESDPHIVDKDGGRGDRVHPALGSKMHLGTEHKSKGVAIAAMGEHHKRQGSREEHGPLASTQALDQLRNQVAQMPYAQRQGPVGSSLGSILLAVRRGKTKAEAIAASGHPKAASHYEVLKQRAAKYAKSEVAVIDLSTDTLRKAQGMAEGDLGRLADGTLLRMESGQLVKASTPEPKPVTQDEPVENRPAGLDPLAMLMGRQPTLMKGEQPKPGEAPAPVDTRGVLDMIKGGIPDGGTIQVGSVTYHNAPAPRLRQASRPHGLRAMQAPQPVDLVKSEPEGEPTRIDGHLVAPDSGLRRRGE